MTYQKKTKTISGIGRNEKTALEDALLDNPEYQRSDIIAGKQEVYQGDSDWLWTFLVYEKVLAE